MEQRVFTREHRTNRLLKVLGPEGGDVVQVHQNAAMYVGALEPGVSVFHSIGEARGVYAYLIDGEASFGDAQAFTGDAAKVTGQMDLRIRAHAPERAYSRRRAHAVRTSWNMEGTNLILASEGNFPTSAASYDAAFELTVPSTENSTTDSRIAFSSPTALQQLSEAPTVRGPDIALWRTQFTGEQRIPSPSQLTRHWRRLAVQA